MLWLKTDLHTGVQARPAAAHHHEQDYFGTLGRRLQQGPPGTVPEEVVDTQADAAMAPMSAMGEAPMAAPAGEAQPTTSLQVSPLLTLAPLFDVSSYVSALAPHQHPGCVSSDVMYLFCTAYSQYPL